MNNRDLVSIIKCFSFLLTKKHIWNISTCYYFLMLPLLLVLLDGQFCDLNIIIKQQCVKFSGSVHIYHYKKKYNLKLILTSLNFI